MPKQQSIKIDIINDQKTSWLLLIGVVLVAANLRVPLTSIGAVISFIRDDLNISNALAGTITTLPLLAFAFLSPFAPKIANRIGMEWTIAFSLVILIVGFFIRSLTGVTFLFLGTLFIGLAIAIGNVLIPAIIKINFPLKIGIMTGVYAICMNIFGALGSGVSAPLASIETLNWKGSLAIWGILALITLIVWLPQLKTKREHVEADVGRKQENSLWRSRLAWQITLFMGCQSLLYYTLITWLPDILQTYGYSSNTAGWIVSLMQFALIPATFIIPIIAERLNNQVGLSIAAASFFIIGFIGLLFGNSTYFLPIWAIMFGIASGSAFSLSMMFFTLRTKNGQEAADLSGMAQSVGYLLAAVGPVLVGALQDLTSTWTIPIIILIVVSFTVLINGISAGKDGYVST